MHPNTSIVPVPDLRDVQIVVGATQRGGGARSDGLVLEQRHDLAQRIKRTHTKKRTTGSIKC